MSADATCSTAWPRRSRRRAADRPRRSPRPSAWRWLRWSPGCAHPTRQRRGAGGPGHAARAAGRPARTAARARRRGRRRVRPADGGLSGCPRAPTRRRRRAGRRSRRRCATRRRSPLADLRACARALRSDRDRRAALGNSSASSDLLVAMGCCGPAPRAPPPTSRINLESLADETFRSDASTRIAAVLDEAMTHTRAASAAQG